MKIELLRDSNGGGKIRLIPFSRRGRTSEEKIRREEYDSLSKAISTNSSSGAKGADL